MTYGLDVDQFRKLIVRPACQRLGLWSQTAENLVVGTALHESHLIYVRQIPNGPALGPFQMEPATHADIWTNYLKYQKDLRMAVIRTCSYFSADFPDHGDLMHNWLYAAAMCRVHYARVRSPLPENTPGDLAAYWKAHYNTPRGKGTIEQALPHFSRACQ